MVDADAGDPAGLAAQDEVLQVMFWLRGERLASDVTVADVARFTGSSAEAITAVLRRLVALGLVTSWQGDAAPRFALTAEGNREGGRRFADEFADLTKPGHGECGDPDCDCQRTGSPEDCRHRVAGLE
ncbi:MAG: helix-turn-helix domain-containing protein [Vicinamibacterales bacterium]